MPRRTRPAIGTRPPPVARAAATTPALHDAARPARPVDRERRVGALRSHRAHERREPRAPPRELEPRTTRKPCTRQRARLHRAVAREAHEHHRRPAPPPREERPLRPVPEREHPGPVRAPASSAGSQTTRTRSVAEPDARDEPERRPPRTARAPLALHPLSSVSFVRARSRAGSFSMARSNICTAFALSPCFALISPR